MNVTDLMFANLQPYEGAGRIPKTVRYRQTVPAPALPEGIKDSRLYLRHLVFQAAEQQFGKGIPPKVKERLEEELSYLFIKEGWGDYFILVRNAIMQARKSIDGCLPLSRSRVACSLVCYLLGLTFTDPLAFNLPFEAFFHLKTDHIPDLTIETDTLSHDRFVSMLKQQYGNHIAPTIQSTVRKDGTIKESISDFRWVLSHEDLSTMAPVREDADIQAHGGTYLHILSMPYIDIVSQTLDLIGVANETKYDYLSSIPLDDPDTGETLQRGDFKDVFWFSNWYDRKKECLRDIKLDSFEKLVSFNTLFRPFLEENVSEYIQRAKGASKIDYPIPEMSEVLAETEGLLLYEEQIILLLMRIANLSGVDAASFVQSMRRQDRQSWEEYYRPLFLEGGRQKGYSAELLDTLFTAFCQYGPYTTSKSHHQEYTLRAFQQAYLKTHYPKEYRAAMTKTRLNNL